jgi:hypothetical protein
LTKTIKERRIALQKEREGWGKQARPEKTPTVGMETNLVS